MPNMRLTDKDVTALLGYIEGESRRIRGVRSGKMADHMQHGGHAGAMDARPRNAATPVTRRAWT